MASAHRALSRPLLPRASLAHYSPSSDFVPARTFFCAQSWSPARRPRAPTHGRCAELFSSAMKPLLFPQPRLLLRASSSSLSGLPSNHRSHSTHQSHLGRSSISYSSWCSRRLSLSKLASSPTVVLPLPVGSCVAVSTSLSYHGLVGVLLWYLDRVRLSSYKSSYHRLR